MLPAAAVGRYALLSETNNPASRSPSSVSRRLTQLLSTLAIVISARMDHNRTPQHALRPNQFDHLVFNAALCTALLIGLEVAEIADVALGIKGAAVGFGERVDCQ